MTYIRIKTIKGLKYKYLVAGKRVGNQVKQKVIKYLGPVNPINKLGKKRTNASLYVKDLSEEEKTELNKSVKSNNNFIKDRARIILFSSKNLFAKQIADKLGCDERKVWKTIKAFNQNGINALQRGKAKGAVPKFNDQIKKIILLHFSKKPRDLNLHFTTWTLPRFRKYLTENKIVESISIETLRQILMKAGAKLKINLNIFLIISKITL